MSYAASLSYDQFVEGIASAVNFPTVMAIFFSFNEGRSITVFILPALIISASVAVWSLIGLAIYALVRVFKLGS